MVLIVKSVAVYLVTNLRGSQENRYKLGLELKALRASLLDEALHLTSLLLDELRPSPEVPLAKCFDSVAYGVITDASGVKSQRDHSPGARTYLLAQAGFKLLLSVCTGVQ
jgi:hypothetical protein